MGAETFAVKGSSYAAAGSRYSIGRSDDPNFAASIYREELTTEQFGLGPRRYSSLLPVKRQ
jgi:hypothetical protein